MNVRVQQCEYNLEIGVPHKQVYTMAWKTWAARYWIPPPNKPEAEQWGNWGICHHTIESTTSLVNEDKQEGRMPQPRCSHDTGGCEAATATFAGRGQGRTVGGYSARIPLGLQLRIPATSPKGICSSHWQWPSPHLVTPPPGSQSVGWGIPFC